ncbi:MAG: hypothetical protein IKL66_04645 [Clostridia bacterium]|nr:hypothetical protein [Clostridia bacterium]
MKRNNVIKAIISLTLSFIMICSLTAPAFAAQPEDTTVQPRWTSIATMEVAMSFVGSDGNVTATARKQSTASHIVGTLYLYKWNGSYYEYMDEVSGSKTVGTLCLSIDFVCEKGVQYKGVLSVVAYTDEHGEYESVYYCETCE